MSLSTYRLKDYVSVVFSIDVQNSISEIFNILSIIFKILRDSIHHILVIYRMKSVSFLSNGVPSAFTTS